MTFEINGRQLPMYALNTLVIGSGAAGYNAADCLHERGQTGIALLTEGVNVGTSRNTGSDKQTYYKLTLSGAEPDSVVSMAKTLFSGGCVDGDTALCEAALSAQCFYKLVSLGVPFPHNRYGEYIGYKTDHDPRQRATSAGPYTSKMMTECLERAVTNKGIRVFDRMQAVRLLVGGQGRIEGVLGLDPKGQFAVFRCRNIVLATGGPASIYENSVYPAGQQGATGMALEAGAKGKNLTEWQYGLASLRPRWNVSGTYMQALPRFISTDPGGDDAREFLPEAFGSRADMLGSVFLKGYQWPFDVRRAGEGSSRIDLLVQRESARGRRVFLDFRSNPGGADIDFAALPDEARDYLERAGACFGQPIDRLRHMNAPAVAFYADKGIDLAREPLEIALCAQHNNGGLDVDGWWQTNIEGLFAVGEVAGTHGVYRPGGSALNAGQVGAARAAQYIAARRGGEPDADFSPVALACIEETLALAGAVLSGGAENARELRQAARRRMSLAGGPLRDREGIARAAAEAEETLGHFAERVRIARPSELGRAFRLRDLLLCQQVYLGAMLDYMDKGGGSRGSALYAGVPGGADLSGKVQEAILRDGRCAFLWRDVRPIPAGDDFFENVWRGYRENGNID